MDSLAEDFLIPGLWGALCGVAISPFWAALITAALGIFLWTYITHHLSDEKISANQPH